MSSHIFIDLSLTLPNARTISELKKAHYQYRIECVSMVYYHNLMTFIFSEVFQNMIQASGHYEIYHTMDKYERGGDIGL